MKTIITMDASSKYFTDETTTLERGNLRNKARSYTHKLNARETAEAISQNRTTPSVLSMLLRRFQNLAQG